MKLLKKAGKALLILFGIILTILLAMSIVHFIISFRERKYIKDVGQTVIVNDEKIQVDMTGSGNRTIVFLAGLGTYSPIEDFKPLAEQLSDEYRVVTIEYPGCGLSADTDRPRTSANIVSDIRGTLKALDIKPPYILAAHSISGIYALEYINEYPEEVEALIGIDPSVPEQINYEQSPAIPDSLYYLSRLMDITGITRMELKNDPLLLAMKDSGSYTDEALQTIKAVKARCSASKALVHESNAIPENMKSLTGMKYPSSLKVLTFLAKDSVDTTASDSVSWEAMHQNMITNRDLQEIIILSGDHYLYWTNGQKIVEETERFLRP